MNLRKDHYHTKKSFHVNCLCLFCGSLYIICSVVCIFMHEGIYSMESIIFEFYTIYSLSCFVYITCSYNCIKQIRICVNSCLNEGRVLSMFWYPFGILIYIWLIWLILFFKSLLYLLYIVKSKDFTWIDNNFQRWMSRLAHRWRTLQTAIRNANC